MLNAHRCGGMEWNQSELGLPWLGEKQDYVEATFYPVEMTDLVTGKKTTITASRAEVAAMLMRMMPLLT